MIEGGGDGTSASWTAPSHLIGNLSSSLNQVTAITYKKGGMFPAECIVESALHEYSAFWTI